MSDNDNGQTNGFGTPGHKIDPKLQARVDALRAQEDGSSFRYSQLTGAVQLAAGTWVSAEAYEKAKEKFAEGALKGLGINKSLAGKMSRKADFVKALSESFGSDGVDFKKLGDALWDETQDSVRDYAFKAGGKKFDLLGKAGDKGLSIIEKLGEKAVGKLRMSGALSKYNDVLEKIYEKGSKTAANSADDAAKAGQQMTGTADDFAKAADDIADDAVKGVSKFAKFGKGIKGVANVGSKTVGRALPFLSGIMEGIDTYNDVNNATTDEERSKAKTVGIVTTGVNLAAGTAITVAATTTLATNFWNPVGWIAGGYLLADGIWSLFNNGKGITRSITENVYDAVTDAPKTENLASVDGPALKRIKENLPSGDGSVTKNRDLEYLNTAATTGVTLINAEVKEIIDNKAPIAKESTNKYAVLEEIKTLQTKINEKITDHNKLKGENEQIALLKVDGKFGQKSFIAADQVGLGNDIKKLLGVDDDTYDKLKNMDYAKSHRAFKAINSNENYEFVAKHTAANATILLEYYDPSKGGIDYAKAYKLDMPDLKQYNIHLNVAESTARHAPVIPLELHASLNTGKERA